MFTFLKRVVPFGKILLNTTDMSEINNEIWTKDLIESGFFFSTRSKRCSLYFKHLMIVNDASSAVNDRHYNLEHHYRSVIDNSS